MRANLRRLAALYGLQTSYTDVFGDRHVADDEALALLLASRGADVSNERQIGKSIDARLRAEASRMLRPVYSVRGERRASISIHVPSHARSAQVRVELESGESREVSVDLARLTPHDDFQECGVARVVKRITIDAAESGYHKLVVTVGRATARALLIVAPAKAWGDLHGEWGVFAPLYALRSRRDWGIGDFDHLSQVVEWARSSGASTVATLPLHSAFCGSPFVDPSRDESPFDPSPYSPVSRLFLNELYISIERARWLGGERAAQAIDARDAERRALAAARLIDYRRVMRLKREILEAIARDFFSADSDARACYGAWITENPEVGDYALFRATTDVRQQTWSAWPPGGLDESNREYARYYSFTQWIAQEQLTLVCAKARESGTGLYLDFPLGSSPDGYDAWKYRDLFLPRVSAGAPPDHSYRSGQDWGFRPMNPDALRESAYDFFIRAVQTQLRYAGMLRIDHVMSLHRLYCVPDGVPPSRGVYMRYDAAELYAILTLESHRHRSTIVGEDLGTVPHYVRQAIDDHGFKRLFVLQRQLTHVKENPPGEIAPSMVASINNHDVAAFASYWRAIDLADRADVGIYDRAALEREMRKRVTARERWIALLIERGLLDERDRDDVQRVLDASHEFLARSDAAIVLINLEDLWLETAPQNTPTTTLERPNWRRRMRYFVEEIVSTEVELKRVR